VSLFVWLLPLNLSGIGDPASSYATAGIALGVSGAFNPHHHDKVGIAAVRGSKPDLGMWDFVMDKSGAGAGFFPRTSVSLANLHSICSPQSSSLSPEAGTIGQEWPQCQEPHKPNKKKKIKRLFEDRNPGT
jgi:hypothetical protein